MSRLVSTNIEVFPCFHKWVWISKDLTGTLEISTVPVVTHPDLMTTAEVAEALRVTEATVTAWVRDSKLAAIRLPGGKGYRFRKSDVDALFDPETAA